MANVKTRIIQKHDSSANWAKATTFVPLKGEIIIYDDLGKIKIGDGATKVNDLQFLDKDAVKQVKLNNVAKTPNTDGVVDLGTVITAHQDISGKVNTSTTIAGKPLTSNISAADLRKALNVADGANQTIVDDSFDSTSINPVQNKVITGMFENFIGIQLVGPNSTSIETDLMSLNRQVSIDESIYNRIRNLHHTYMTSGAPCNTYIYLGSINVFAFAGVHGDTFNFITLNDHGYDEADIYLLRIFPDNTAIVTSVQNQFNSKYAAESELASYVTRNGSETITGQKTFSQTGSYAPLSVINNSSTEDEEELIIKSGRLTHYYADSTYCEILNLPYKGGVDPEEYTLATTDDLVQAYEKITRSTSSLTNTSYNTM